MKPSYPSPIIGISAGDPAGIGLEVTLKAVPEFLASTRFVLFTDAIHFNRSNTNNIPFRWIKTPGEISKEPILFLVDVPGSGELIPWGETSLRAGSRASAYLSAASNAAMQGDDTRDSHGAGQQGLHRTAFQRSNRVSFRTGRSALNSPWHSLRRRSKLCWQPCTCLSRMRWPAITTQRYVDLITFVNRELLRFGFPDPKIAVAAINPHAGEGGMFGREDMDVLEPAVNTCAAMGIHVSGPHSADSLYYRAHTGEFDVVIAPYHDQGLIPVKLIAHGDSTNVTLGLPYIRTSPDHGTAFQIAGQNVADPAGMTSAIRCAIDLLSRRS